MTVHEQTKQNPFRLLEKGCLLLNPSVADKAGLISLLVHRLCQGRPQLDPAYITSQVLAREKGVSTTLDTGLSIPHARVEERDDFAVAMAVFHTPLADGKAHPVRVMFLFLSPAKAEFFPKHLQLLAALAKTFTAEVVDQVTSCPDEASVRALLAR